MCEQVGSRWAEGGKTEMQHSLCSMPGLHAGCLNMVKFHHDQFMCSAVPKPMLQDSLEVAATKSAKLPGVSNSPQSKP